ncbi:MAG: hypothetical protein HRU26_14215, partial [Psychroserpens sp.]|nr:hypothetical protein [Psychroserpens sp.]
MPFSPDEFKAKSPIDFALPSTFLMRIPTTVLGAEVDYSELENLSFLCSQSVLPGRHFSTGEYTTHGPVRRTPYQSIYDQLQVSIFCRSDLLERKFFDHWQNAIQSDDTYKWRYFREYVTDLELWYFTRSIPAETTRGQHSQRNSEGNPSAQG